MTYMTRIAAYLTLIMLLCGCRAQKVVEYRTLTDTVRVATIDTLRVTEWRMRIDSVAVRDTTKVYLEGETKVIERTKLVDRWRIDSTGIASLRIKCDSLSRAKATSTVVEKPVVTNVLRWWQKLLMTIGGLAIAAVAVVVGIKCLKK